MTFSFYTTLAKYIEKWTKKKKEECQIVPHLCLENVFQPTNGNAVFLCTTDVKCIFHVFFVFGQD